MMGASFQKKKVQRKPGDRVSLNLLTIFRSLEIETETPH